MDLLSKICFLFAGLEIIVSLLFACKVSFATWFLSGYRKLSEIQKTQIDQDAIFKDARNETFRLALVLIVGGFLAMHHWLYGLGALGATAVVLMKNIQNDPEQRYGSYRRL